MNLYDPGELVATLVAQAHEIRVLRSELHEAARRAAMLAERVAQHESPDTRSEPEAGPSEAREGSNGGTGTE